MAETDVRFSRPDKRSHDDFEEKSSLEPLNGAHGSPDR